MSWEQGYADLQTTTEDYTKTARFKASTRHKKKSDADKAADRARAKGKRARKINEDGYWVVYTRG